MSLAPDINRRPIAARRLGAVNRLAARLAARGVRPNAISGAGLIAAGLAGGLLAVTPWCPSRAASAAALLVAAVLVQFRLLCNLLDGLVAVEGGLKSPTGEIYNEVPDRFADAAVLIGAGYAVGSDPTLGWAAAVGAVLVAYIRAVGRSLGFPSDFRGPMAKQQRMFAVTAACVLAAAWPAPVRIGDDALGPIALALVVIILGCLMTFARRLRTLMSNLHARDGAS